MQREGRHVAAMKLLRETVGAALRPDEDQGETALVRELVDQPVELVLGRDGDEVCSTSSWSRSSGGRASKWDAPLVYALASSPTSPSSVAEKSIVCRSSGRRRTRRSTCGLKPMSSMRSASSSTSRTRGERDEPAFDEVLQAAWCRDQDVGSARALRLAGDRRAAVDGGDAKLLRLGEPLELRRHLGGELARGNEHERGRARRQRARRVPGSAARRQTSCPSRSAPWPARPGRRARPEGRASGSEMGCGCRAARAVRRSPD